MINVMHLDTEKGFRGGENQIRFLLEGMKTNQEFNSFFVGQPDGKAISRLECLCECIPLKMSGGYDLIAASKLKSITKKYNIDIVDAHSSNAHSIALLAKMLGGKFKLLVHRRVDNVPKRKWITQKKYLSRLVDHYIPISNAICQIMKDYGVSERKLSVVRSAVDNQFYLKSDQLKDSMRSRLSDAFNLDSAKKWVACAAAFTEQKGHMTLIKAWSNLPSELRSASLLILAGDGELLEDVRSFYEQNISDGSVVFLGWIDNVPDLLVSSDIFAMSSNWEGLGTILLEAAHARMPVCSTKVGGIPEIIEHQKTGLLSFPGDDKGFSKNLRTLLTDAELSKKYALALAKKALEEFSLDSMVSGNIAIYKKIME